MSDDQHNALLDAVDALTQPRKIHTTITNDDGETGIHTEEHPALLVLLMNGASSHGDSKSSDPGIPIDADAIEILAQIRDLIRLWCKKSGTVYWPYDLVRAIRAWYIGHENLRRSGKVSDETDKDITRMVEGWVRMIETKFDPPKKREWELPCPAWVMDGETWHRCDARRIVVAGIERFAIMLNITAWSAECAACGTKWDSTKGIHELRFESNVWEAEKADTLEKEISAELITSV